MIYLNYLNKDLIHDGVKVYYLLRISDHCLIREKWFFNAQWDSRRNAYKMLTKQELIEKACRWAEKRNYEYKTQYISWQAGKFI